MKKQTAPATPSLNDLIQYVESGTHFAFDAGAGQQIIDRMRANYARLYTLYQDVTQAQEEGVYEVSIRSATKTVTMQVKKQTGYDAAEELFNELSQSLAKLNKSILHQLKNQQQTLAQYPSGEINEEDALIHTLCLPTAPVATGPAKAEGERCPFLPASTVPAPSRRPAPVPVG